MNMPRCAHCPVPADRPCLGLTQEFSHFCAWAQGGDDLLRRTIIGRSAASTSASTAASPDLIRQSKDSPPGTSEESLRSFPPARQLVIAAFQEDLSWLARVTIPSVVYTKGSAGSRLHPNVPLPNVGREAHSYLSHIVRRWEELADWTFFVQGDPFDHAPDIIERLNLNYRRRTPLTARYRADFPTAAIREFDRVEWVSGLEVRYGDARHFGLRSEQAGPWIERGWNAVFACPVPEPLWFGYGAMWAVPRAAIHARPLALWKHLLAQIEGPAGRSRHDLDGAREHPLNAWWFEIAWLYLWSDPQRFPHHAHLSGEPERSRPSVATSLDLIRRMKACPAWEPSSSCGCGFNRCKEGKGKLGIVSHADCFACLTNQEL